MQRDIIVKSRGLGGSSDLTLLAPIKPGFIESLESITYKTRIKRVLETLHGARAASHEYSTARLLSDSVERVGAIHSVRVAVLEPEDKVLLAVTFDGSWESYIRVLWDKVGTLLDLIFCGTENYVTAFDHTFDEWLVWARRVQIETGFFYGPPDSTARDVLYERRVERMRARGAGTELNEIRAMLPSAEEAAERIFIPRPEFEDEPRIAKVSDVRMPRERIRMGMKGLAALYRLTDLHRPGTPDGEVLRKATIDLLLEFAALRDSLTIDRDLEKIHKTRFARQLDWLFPPGSGDSVVARRVPAPAEKYPPLDRASRRAIQGGILRAYNKITHGLVLMLAFDNAAAVGELLAHLDSPGNRVTNDDDSPDAEPGVVFRNFSVTPAGLRMAGIGEDALELFPQEFRQGMAARAGLLGDVRNNHPLRWRLPRRLDAIGKPPRADAIELESVHAVLHLRCSAIGNVALELWEKDHPLRKEVEDLCATNPGMKLLAVQPLMRRYRERNGEQVITEHFGYLDGNGQPDVEAPPAPAIRNRAHVGEIVLGYDNAADFAVNVFDPSVPDDAKERMRWLANGSFLVMRKYRQFVHRLEVAVGDTAANMANEIGGDPKVLAEEVYGKLMGRKRDGEPLIPHSGQLNNFIYDGDPQGAQCPLHAHIRLANPRVKKEGAQRRPRLMRRSMSYGPEHKRGKDDDDMERGLVFMAYNASIGEQYEVVQRWLSGSNSTGSTSALSCPVVGVPENGFPRHFPFEYEDKSSPPRVFRVGLENATPLFEEPEAITRLEWGMYLFTPSISAIRKLRTMAATAVALVPRSSVPWQVARGRRLIADLKQIETEAGQADAIAAWKAAIEDPESIDRLDGAAIWAAIREDHGGLLKTSYGTLVAGRELLHEVFLNTHERYSVCGQFDRMKRSFGEISLGMDAGPIYEEQSGPINEAIRLLTKTNADKEYVFRIAFGAASEKIRKIVEEAKNQAVEATDTRFEVTFEAREILDEVLADLCEEWFGLNDDPRGRFSRGGGNWAWKRGEPPPYPGHFTAMSRYMFQPVPGKTVIELGESYGQALREAMNLFVADHRGAGTLPQAPSKKPAPIARATFCHPTQGADNDFVARNMVGVLMGFNPTIIGAVLNVLREWQREGHFGAMRTRLAGRTNYQSAHAVLKEPMAAAARMRPMPQIAWRTALKPHRLGPAGPGAVEIGVGDVVLLGLGSGPQQSLADGKDDGRLMFGGVRSATPHPLHACPGYEAGIEAMLGTLAALLTSTETMRQGSSPLTFILEGESGYVPPASEIEFAAYAKVKTPTFADDFVVQGQKVTMMAWGDSWLSGSLAGVDDLKVQLMAMGHDIVESKQYCDFWKWGKIERMAAKNDGFCTTLVEQLGTVNKPKVILLSGGGNDSTGGALLKILNTNGSATVVNGQALKDHIAKLRGFYVTVLDAIKTKLKDNNLPNIPVIVHGYDNPIPKNRTGLKYGWLERTWLKDPFENPTKGYVIDGKWDGVPATAMADLIKALNEMLDDLANNSNYSSFLHHVDLRGIIKKQWDADPTQGWADDLHPTSDAFVLLARRIDETIQTL